MQISTRMFFLFVELLATYILRSSETLHALVRAFCALFCAILRELAILLSNNTQLPRQKFSAGKGFFDFFDCKDTSACKSV